MRYKSNKAAALDVLIKAIHDEWKEVVGPSCMMPDCPRQGTETHEICGGPRRMESRQKTAAILWLCRECHTWMHGLPEKETVDRFGSHELIYMVKLGVSLAIKRESDPKHYCGETVRRIMHPTAVVFDAGDILYGYSVLENRETT